MDFLILDVGKKIFLAQETISKKVEKILFNPCEKKKIITI